MIRRFVQTCSLAAMLVSAVGCMSPAPEGEETVGEAREAITYSAHVEVLDTQIMKDDASQPVLVQFDEISAATHAAALAGQPWSLHATFLYRSVVGDFSWVESTRAVAELYWLGDSGAGTVYVATLASPWIAPGPDPALDSIGEIIGPDYVGPSGGPGHK